VDVNFQDTGSPVTGLYVTATPTRTDLMSVGYNVFGSEPGAYGRVTIVPTSPALLGVGVHTGTITVKACLDALCVNEIAGSPATITVRFTVTDTLPGPDGYRVKQVAATGNDIAWDAARNRFYVSIASSATSNANTIGVLDPVSGAFSAYAPVGNNPGDLEISPDGQYLYVSLRGAGSIQRLSLPSLDVDLTIPLGVRPDGRALYAREMHVQPGASRTIAVARSGQPVASVDEYDLAVFDDAAMRPQTAGTNITTKIRTFQWESAARIFASDSSNIFHVGVDASGSQITTSQQTVGAFDYRMRLADGRLYTERGRVFDPLTFAQVGQFAIDSPFGSLVIPDVGTGRAYFLVAEGVKSFNLSTQAPLASILIPDGSFNRTGTKMIRWGADGLAVMNYLRGAPRILLINAPLVNQ
jgi:DNA-binding beta-propeller fold protein YncE